MNKILISFVLIFSTTFNHAEQWTNGFSHGSEEYSLKNNKKQSINFSCNEGMGENTENGFWFKNGNEVFDEKDDIAILVNSYRFIPVPKETKSEKGSMDGILFISSLATAKTIDVYHPMKSQWLKVGEFKADFPAKFKDCPTVELKKIR